MDNKTPTIHQLKKQLGPEYRIRTMILNAACTGISVAASMLRSAVSIPGGRTRKLHFTSGTENPLRTASL